MIEEVFRISAAVVEGAAIVMDRGRIQAAPAVDCCQFSCCCEKFEMFRFVLDVSAGSIISCSFFLLQPLPTRNITIYLWLNSTLKQSLSVQDPSRS